MRLLRCRRVERDAASLGGCLHIAAPAGDPGATRRRAGRRRVSPHAVARPALGGGLVYRPDGGQPSPWQVGTHCPAIVPAPSHLSATAGSRRRGVARGSYFPPSLRSVSHLLAAAAEH